MIALVRVLSGSLVEGDRLSIIEPASYDEILAGDGNNENVTHKVGKDTYSIQESELRKSCCHSIVVSLL